MVDPTKAPPGEDSITGDFLKNVSSRIEGLELDADAEVAFRVLFEETKTAIQRLENLLRK